MKNITIKNCPAYYEELCLDDADIAHYGCEADYLFDKGCKCKEIDNCIIKRMIAQCNEAIEVYDNEEFYEDDKDTFCSKSIMAQKIIDLFKIEGKF